MSAWLNYKHPVYKPEWVLTLAYELERVLTLTYKSYGEIVEEFRLKLPRPAKYF